jgi:hypothetical protein
MNPSGGDVHKRSIGYLQKNGLKYEKIKLHIEGIYVGFNV